MWRVLFKPHEYFLYPECSNNISSQFMMQLREEKQSTFVVLSHQLIILLNTVSQQTREHSVILETGKLLSRHLSC
jgi:hypothetical protein